MLTKKKIGFIGAGNMAGALAGGLLSKGSVKHPQLCASDHRQNKATAFHDKFSVFATTDNGEIARRSDIVVLAVKPQAIQRVLEEIAPHVTSAKLVVSIAAGVPIAAIEAILPKGSRVVRVMPNVAALVHESASVISGGDHASEEDVTTVKTIFDAVGKTLVLEEYQLDAVTGLSGSGPAYIFLIVDALADAGVKVGLSRSDSLMLAAQTVLGSAKLLIETGEHPGRLKDMVTSPGGTAIAGIHTLEEGGLRTTLINAVERATQRSRELGSMPKIK